MILSIVAEVMEDENGTSGDFREFKVYNGNLDKIPDEIKEIQKNCQEKPPHNRDKTQSGPKMHVSILAFNSKFLLDLWKEAE